MTSGSERNDFPTHIGRYRVTGQIATGSFGDVLRARDEDLDRDVAIKVPHADQLASEKALETFLAEARVLASLDHPGIVPVYDVGSTEAGLYFLVTKLVEGTDLKVRLQRARPAHAESVEIAASVAEALHAAHRHGLVHRDVKPANILLDASCRPMLIDFGLALRDQDYGTGPNFVGTVLYMSPEQARREGNRVDARTDVYSLGVVLYEMLTGRRPFAGATRAEVLEQIASAEPRPPRQLDDTIPAALDHICLRALANRLADRYSTARDLAEDLRAWQAVGAGGPRASFFSDAGPRSTFPLDASVQHRSVAETRGSVAETRTPLPTPATPRRRKLRWVLASLAVVAIVGLMVALGWPTIHGWLSPPPTYPNVSVGNPVSLFDGLTVAPPDWITSEGSWGEAQDEEGARVLAGRGIIRRHLPALSSFRILLGVNLHRSSAAEVHFAVRDDGSQAQRYVLRMAPDGVQLGSRAGDRGPFQRIGNSIPLNPSGGSREYREVRVERLGANWWAFIDGQLVATVPVPDRPPLFEFRLVIEGGQARFSDLEVSELIPSPSP